VRQLATVRNREWGHIDGGRRERRWFVERGSPGGGRRTWGSGDERGRWRRRHERYIVVRRCHDWRRGDDRMAGGGGVTSVDSPGCAIASPLPACDVAGSPCTIDVNGLTREYYLVLPTGFTPGKAERLVFAWHYSGGTAAQIMGNGYGGSMYGLKSRMTDTVFVTPQGIAVTPGGVDYGWPNTGGRDIAFARALLSAIAANYCIDTSRVFSTGFSYGGIMSVNVGCQMGDAMRAIGVMSGALFGGTRSCAGTPVAAWFTHGDADPTVAISGGEAARDAFLTLNGCDAASAQPLVLDANTTCTLYTTCSAGNDPVVWCPVSGGVHAIPSFASAEIAKFFNQF
jgi:poly(3-hydroxybutyrate) depolymerase